jgi:hypothetical protein
MDEDGYPQFFQYVRTADGPDTIDRMRPHDLIGEAAIQAGWQPSGGTMLSLYGALAGQPALGAPPAELRASGVDFAEAPFAYDIQETTHDSTKVVTAGFSTARFAIEASMFHDAVSTGDHTEIPDGDIDSQSARITLRPASSLMLQVSRGELGEGTAKRDVTSASLSYGGAMTAFTALWTRREYDSGRAPETAYGGEVTIRGARHSFLLRAEHLDRPAGFPFPDEPVLTETDSATHFTAGYLFDFIASARYRTGVGVNIDYRTQTRHLEEVYGHKPQGIYAFVRLRTD